MIIFFCISFWDIAHRTQSVALSSPWLRAHLNIYIIVKETALLVGEIVLIIGQINYHVFTAEL